MSPLTRRLAALPYSLRRCYGSAAAAHLDYDYNYDSSELDGWETGRRGAQWVILGNPMLHRHVYARRLANLLRVPHISMGSLVRQDLNPNSPLYKEIASAVNRGKLVGEDVIFGLLSQRLEEGYCRGESGFILDGIPRTTVQAEILDQIADVDLVLNLRCKDDLVVNKTSLVAAGLDANFHANSVKEKLGVYSEQIKPVEEYYKKQKKIVNFQVTGAPAEDTWEGLLAALQLQHMTCSNSHKLTA